MNIRMLLAAVAAVGLLSSIGCTTTSGKPADPAARRQTIDASVDQALSRLHNEVPGSREMVANAKGVLVFPRVVGGGFIVGGSHGDGALREAGKTVSYWSTTSASVGLLAGAQSQALYVLFMTQEALDNFKKKSSGWTAGADGSVTLINVGASANVNTQTARQPIVGYVLSNAGLMANLSLDGTRFQRLDL